MNLRKGLWSSTVACANIRTRRLLVTAAILTAEAENG